MKRLALIFALMLVIAACGGGTDSAPATDTGPDTSLSADDGATLQGEEVADTSQDEHGTDEHMEGDEHGTDEHMDDMDDMEHMEEEYLPTVTGEPTKEVEIALHEFSFDPDLLLVSPGETVRFTLVNEGDEMHEFRLSNEHRVEEHLAAGHDHSGTSGHHDEDRDIIVYVHPGETRTVDISFPDESTLYTELVCLIEGHYEQGMHADLMYTG